MKKKIFSKVISFTLVIAMLSSFATISAFAESKDDVETNQDTVSTYSNDVAGYILRSILFSYLYNANPNFTSTLKNLKLNHVEMIAGGGDFVTITSSFFTENIFTKLYIDVNIVVAIKDFWVKAVDRSKLDSYIVLNILQIILSTLTSGAVGGNPEAVEYIHKQINSNFSNISNANSIKNAIKQMNSEDILICIPTVLYKETFLGIIKEPVLEQPCYTAIIRNGELNMPDNVEIPNWVSNGPPVNFIEAY